MKKNKLKALPVTKAMELFNQYHITRKLQEARRKEAEEGREISLIHKILHLLHLNNYFPYAVLISLILLGESLIYPSPSLSVSPPDLLAQSGSQPGIDLLNQGLQAIQAGRVQDAIALFRKATQLDPRLAPAHYNLGLALRQAGELQPAADAFYQATQADPKFAPAFANLGGSLLEGNNLQLANDYLQRALELDSKLGFAHTRTRF